MVQEIVEMKCPACARELSTEVFAHVTVDVCRGGCAGIWFDQFELQKFDEQHEAEGEELLGIERGLGVVVVHTKRIKCPKCPDSVMMRNFFSVKKAVEIDECPTCGSIWLDIGELGQIRRMFKSQEERKAAAAEYFKAVLGGRIAVMQSEGAEQLSRARKIARIFRFICPSYYIPGEQGWGAF